MKFYAAQAFVSARKKLNPNKHGICYELFGLDYILDSDFNTWLIEVNTNPSLEESSKILQKLLARMLNDSFKITLDQIFPDPK
jgi:D-alanine-D-alanine ligase-like ATP-grasp enzyme